MEGLDVGEWVRRMEPSRDSPAKNLEDDGDWHPSGLDKRLSRTLDGQL